MFQLFMESLVSSRHCVSSCGSMKVNGKYTVRPTKLWEHRETASASNLTGLLQGGDFICVLTDKAR